MHRIIFALILGLATFAHAQEDPTRIAGGPRQAHDAIHCAVYEPTWPLLDRYVASIPELYTYGPEALIPAAPAENTNDPEATAAVSRWFLFARMDAAYAGREPSVPTIGYDQLKAAYEVVDEWTGGGPRLPTVMPKIGADPRVTSILRMVQSMSQRRELSADQLTRITAILLQVPTCGGEVYPS